MFVMIDTSRANKQRRESLNYRALIRDGVTPTCESRFKTSLHTAQAGSPTLLQTVDSGPVV